MKRLYLTILVAMATLLAHAAAPNGSGTYYQNANGKKGAALKTAMCGIIYNRTQLQYDDLWTAFKTTDKRSDGKIWDMYSNITNYTPVTSGSSYSVEGDCYNREHSFPASWFGKAAPMYTDLHHLYPTDAKVNGMRSNYPFGTTTGNKYKSANDFSKLGDCTYSGYTGTVFEPNDEYKGDFARTYFYMITCYEEKLADWYSKNSESRATIDGSTYPGFQTWQLNMLLEWARNDAVSQKEINRNNAVYSIQHNRNPFIDYPGLEEYIWGTKTNETFSYDNYDGSSSGSGGQGGQGGGTTGEAETYKLTITTSDFNSTSYAANNNEKTSQAVCTTDASKTYEVKWTSNQVMLQSSAMQWQKNTGYIYNGTDLGTISSVVITSSEGTFTTYYGTTSQPSSSTTVGNGFFKICVGNALGKSTQIEITFTIAEAEPPTLPDPTLYSTAKTVAFGSPFTLVRGTDFVTDGDITLSSFNDEIATTSGLTVTPQAVGTTTIYIEYAASSNYNAGSSSFTFTVTAPEGEETAAPSGSATTVFKETFAQSTGTNNDFGTSTSSDGNGDYHADNSWSNDNVYGANGSAKFGASKKKGRGTTPSINAIVGTIYTLTFKAAPWASESTTMNVTATGASISGISTSAMSIGQWNNYSATLTATSSNFTITFEANNNRFFLDEVEVTKPGEDVTLTATLNGSGYATYCSQYPLSFTGNEDYTAWQVTGVSGTTITFSQVTGSVKGGTGLLLMGTPSATVTLTSVASSNTLDGNLLYGTLAPTYVESETYYGLKGNEFVKVNAGTVPAGKALLPASLVDGSEVKSFTFVFESADGIHHLMNDEEIRNKNEEWNATNGRHGIFNLAGQRLSRPQRGVNIINGKKVIVR